MAFGYSMNWEGNGTILGRRKTRVFRNWKSAPRMQRACHVETRRIRCAARSVIQWDWTALRSLAIVVTQHATEAFPTLDLTSLPTNFGAWIDDSILQSLMITFKVVVSDELLQGPLQ